MGTITTSAVTAVRTVSLIAAPPEFSEPGAGERVGQHRPPVAQRRDARSGPALVAKDAERRAAGRRKLSLETARILAGSSPESSKAARARPYHVVAPDAVPW